MAEVFLCKTGQLTPSARRQLKDAGIVVVEVEDPSTCQFIRATEAVCADDMVWAAVDALRHNFSYSSQHRERFAINVFGLIEAARAKRTGPVVRDLRTETGEPK